MGRRLSQIKRAQNVILSQRRRISLFKEVRDCHVRKSGLAMTSIVICVQIIFLFAFSSFVYSEEVKPICDREYFPAVHSLLKGAKKSIYLIISQIRYYEKYPESSANLLCKDLIGAARRGVKVKVIIEQSSSHALDNSKSNREVGYRLAQGGVTVYFDPLETNTHCKYAYC